MAQGQDSNEKIVYVGDSRVRKRTNKPVPKDYSAFPGKTEAFVPNFLLKEWMVGAVFLVGYMALVIAAPPPLGYPADPNNAEFIPMPDWYFLFLYQFLKYPYVAGDFAVLGAVVFPGLMFTALALAPFLDRGPERRWYKRPVASGLMLVTFVAIIYLTKVSWDGYTQELAERNMEPEHITRARLVEEARKAGKDPFEKPVDRSKLAIVDEDSEGYEIYTKSTCVTCHMPDLRSGAANLRGIGDVHSKDKLIEIMKEGIGGMPGVWNDNLAQGLTEDDLDKLAEWLSIQKAPEE